jgi:hypothetical protein
MRIWCVPPGAYLETSAGGDRCGTYADDAERSNLPPGVSYPRVPPKLGTRKGGEHSAEAQHAEAHCVCVRRHRPWCRGAIRRSGRRRRPRQQPRLSWTPAASPTGSQLRQLTPLHVVEPPRLPRGRGSSLAHLPKNPPGPGPHPELRVAPGNTRGGARARHSEIDLKKQQ